MSNLECKKNNCAINFAQQPSILLVLHVLLTHDCDNIYVASRYDILDAGNYDSNISSAARDERQ